jgi:CheY-like chemotaxis protein
MDAIVMSGYFDFEDYERCDSLGATAVEKGNGFWPQLREALVDLLPGGDREAIERDESWDDLRQIPSTPRILIADADPSPADLLKSRLKKFGIEVLTAPDILQGFRVARNEMPSMIVAANHFCDGDAERLLWKLRSSPRTRQLRSSSWPKHSASTIETTSSVTSRALLAPPGFSPSRSTPRCSIRPLSDIAVSRRSFVWRRELPRPRGCCRRAVSADTPGNLAGRCRICIGSHWSVVPGSQHATSSVQSDRLTTCRLRI